MRAPITISRFDALCKLLANGSKQVMVGFKDISGKQRYMIGHPDIFASISGTGLRYNPIEKGLLVVSDAEKDGPRMLNVKTLRYLVLDEQAYMVED